MQPVPAKESQAWTWCARHDEQAISPDLQLAGCTTVIQSRGETQEDLAIAFSNRGIAYDDKGDNDRAIQDYDQAIRLEPAFARAFHNRGLAYHAKGDNDRAIQDYGQAIRLRPGYAYAFENRGIAYHAKGDYDRAIQDYDQAIRLKPDYASAFYSRGSAYRGKGDYDRAIQDYDQAIRLKPDNAGAFNGRCWTRAIANEGLEAALSDCNESLRLRPGDANTFDSRGFVYFRMGQYDKAITDYDATLERKPKSASSLYLRGLAKRRSHDQISGDADIAAAKAIDPKIAKTYADYGVNP